MIADYAQARAHKTSAPTIAFHGKALLRWWGDRMCDAISPETCLAYARERGRSTRTAINELKVLRSALNYAVDRGRMTRKVGVELPSAPPQKDRWLTRDEVARLLWAARRTPHLATFIMIAVYTAGRKGAILEMRWPQVDFDKGHIDLKGDKIGGKGRAKNPMPAQLAQRLRYRKRFGSDTGYVVTFRGRPIDRIDKAFRAAVESAKLSSDVTPHTLRHTALTWLAQAGVDMWEIAGWAGHDDVDTTKRHYLHHSPDHKKSALASMQRRRK